MDGVTWLELMKKRDEDVWESFEALSIAKSTERYEKNEGVAFTTDSSEAQRLLGEYRFDDGYGGEEGQRFTLWTTEWVYFPACYDGAEWVARVPRHPTELASEHVGGG